MYIKKLVGERLYLSPINPDDYVKFTHWINDNQTTIYTSQLQRTYSFNSERDVLSSLARDQYTYAMVDMDTNEAIGVIGFVGKDPLHRNAELGIFIGDKDYLSKGYGTEAILLLLDFGFNVLNLNNVMLKYHEFNKRAGKCYEKCGFKEFGRRHQAMIFGDRKIDTIYMEILAQDFNRPSFIDELIK